MTFSTLYLNPLTISDLPAAIELDQRCFGGLWNLAGYQREIESPNSDLLLLCCDRMQGCDDEDNCKHSIGLACLWRILDEAHITLLAVHPDVQRQGLGQLLLYQLLLRAHQAQMNRATLEVRSGNKRAIGLYQKFGFKLAGNRRGYYQATQEDALIFWRSGLQNPNFALELGAWKAMILERLTQCDWQWCE
ncbi:MAG: ribosomal protein S18-alanine N-acetyltransferase [Spirulina sp. SIO3F2]|nr:ribosomal protein S18-alanine N-acetyltransferase [Spirulina sp. SIO3F2]